MKTPFPKPVLLIIGLLTAGAISSAQTNIDSYVMPKTTSPNFYLEAGPSYMRTSDSDIKNFIGGGVAFGWRIAKKHKIQFEAGVYASNSTSDSKRVSKPTYYYYTLSSEARLTAIPLLVSYSYCIMLDTAGRSELRLTPTAGLLWINGKFNVNWNAQFGGYYAVYEVSNKASDNTYAIGASVGYTYHFSSKFYLDASFRYLRAGKTDYDYFSDKNVGVYASATLDAMNTYGITASFGWKF